MTRTALGCALLSIALGCEAPPLETADAIEWIPTVDLALPMVEGNGELYLDAPELWSPRRTRMTAGSTAFD